MRRIPWRKVVSTIWTVAKILIVRRHPQAGPLVAAVDELAAKR